MNKRELKTHINSRPQGCCILVMKDGMEDEVDIMFFPGDASKGIGDIYTARTANYEEEHESLDSLVNWLWKEFETLEAM